MKKNTFILLLFLISVSGSYAQCIRTSLYPEEAVVSNNLGLQQQIADCSYTSEYSSLTGITVGSNYIFTCNLGTDGLGAAKYITITDLSNTVIAYGPSPLTVNAITASSVKAHWSNDAACTSSSSCHKTTVQIVLTCAVPTEALVSNITTSNASFTWTPGGTETNWEVLILPIGSPAPTNTTVGVPVSTTPLYLATGLSGGTEYQFYYRSNCGTEFSPWNVQNFITNCVSVSTFNQNFDASTSFPACWSKVGSGGYAYVDSIETAASPPNVLYMVSYSTTEQAVVVMPPVSNAELGAHRLKFKARSAYSDEIGGKIEVGYLTDISDESTFVSLETFTTVSTTFNIFIAELGTEPVGQNLAFRHSGNPSYAVFIDDVVWDLIPPCPDVSLSGSNNATISSVNITWEAGGAETSWQYVYGATSVTDPTTLTPVGVTINPEATITGLSPQTSYKVWVRSDCGVSGFGAWIGPIIVTTPCLPMTTLPWTEDFDSLSAGNNIFPACWTYVNNLKVWSIYDDDNIAYSGVNTLSRTWSTDGWAFTPNATLTAGISYTLSYYVRTYDETVGYNITVAVGNAQSVDNMNEELSNVIGYHEASWTKITHEFIPTATGTYSFGLHVAAGSDPSGIYFDNFKLAVTPTCIEPTALEMSNITDISAIVSWTESTTIPTNGYEYYLSTSNVFPTASTVATGSVGAGITTTNLISLSGNTTYYLWVRSICNATNSSDWSNMVSFVTNCTPVTTFSENFDASFNFPSCWDKVGSGGYSYVDYNSSAPSSSNILYMISYESTSQAVVAMPTISNSGAGTHRLKFKLKAAYEPETGAVIEVGYLENRTDASSFVSLESFTASSGTFFEDKIAEFGVDASISQNIAFRHSGVPAYSVLIDNVTWDVIPTVIPACATGIVATPNSSCGNFATQITWAATPGSDGYLLTMGTTSGGTDVFNNENIGSNPTYSFVGNMSTTYYYTITPFNSVGNAVGCAQQSFITNANGCYCTSVPESLDNDGITNVLLGTVNFPNEDVTYSDYTATPVDLAQDDNVNLQISFGTGYTYYTYVFIDLNDNYTFEESEQLYSGESSEDNPTVLDASFVMPATAALGPHRMRLVTYDGGSTSLAGNPCYSGSYGVTIDFISNITAPLKTNSFDSSGFSYYPNPIKEVLNLAYVNEITNVAVYNLLGQQVIAEYLNANQTKIDMSHLTRGTYLVKVTADNQVKTIKVIKE